MTTGLLLRLACGAVVVACLLLVGLIVVTKLRRTRLGRRSAALVAPYRADLLAVSVGEDPDGAHLARLAAVDGPARIPVDDAMAQFLAKVRGTPADLLQQVLREHGAITRAVDDLTSRSPVRRAMAAHLLNSVQALLTLRYPRHEVVVVDDGSTDATFERLRDPFDLVPIPREIPAEIPVRVRVLLLPLAGDRTGNDQDRVAV